MKRSNLRSESAAMESKCPWALALDVGEPPARSPANRFFSGIHVPRDQIHEYVDFLERMTMCVGSVCMSWRFEKDPSLEIGGEEGLGYCGRAGRDCEG